MATEPFSMTIGSVRRLLQEEKESASYKYVTIGEYVYKCGEVEIKVPIGFLSDGSSGGPDYGNSWLFHDYLYSTHRFTSGQICTRHEADNVMKKVLENERMTCYSWGFVKLSNLNPFYLFSKAWRTSGNRGPEFISKPVSSSEDSYSD